MNLTARILSFCAVSASLPSVSAAVSIQQKHDLYRFAPYRAGVPKPETVLGYPLGQTHTTFRDQERVLTAIAAAAKDRVVTEPIGTSVEGRPLRLLIVTSPNNLKRLKQIQETLRRIGDTRRAASAADTERAAADLPAVVWINHTIHGDETASFEAAMWTLYTLAASENAEIMRALQNCVVILNPVYNPDGHERFVVYSNSLDGRSAEAFAADKRAPWAVVGRFNHFRFDLNRDKVAQSQPETRADTAAVLRWLPQVYVDQHGQPEVYFFPPNSRPTHRHLDRDRIDRWTDIFGRANAKVFDTYGWPYVNREQFDFFYPGYLDTFSSLIGAIGMTYETDAGGALRRRRADGTVATLRDGAVHHIESAIATVFSASQNRRSLLHDWMAYRRQAVAATAAEKMQAVVLSGDNPPDMMAEFAAHMALLGIETRWTSASMSISGAVEYMAPADSRTPKQAEIPAGSLVVDLNQPHGRLARALLEPDPEFTPDFVREQTARRERNLKRNKEEPQEQYDFYDTSAWSLPYAYGLRAWWTSERVKIDTPADPPAPPTYTLGEEPPTAWLIPYTREGAAVVAARMAAEGWRVMAAHRPVRADNRDYPAGSFILFRTRNSPEMPKRLLELSRQASVPIVEVKSIFSDNDTAGLGSDWVRPVAPLKIAVVLDDAAAQTGYGSVWWTLEQKFGLNFTPVPLRALTEENLSRFNVVLFPDGSGYSSALGKAGAERLKAWISGGGVAISMSGSWFTEKETALSTASEVGRDASDKEPEKRPTWLPGAIFRGRLQRSHFLGFGLRGDEIAVPLSGSVFLKPSTTGSNVVTFEKDSRLSGFVWPGSTENHINGTAWLIDEPVGNGHAILFLEDPTFRGAWPGLRRMLLNAMLFGVGRTPLVPKGFEEVEPRL